MQHLHDIRDAARRAVTDGNMPALTRLAATLVPGGRGGGDAWLRGMAEHLTGKATR